MELNYFVCTLGQAASSGVSRGSWQSVNDLIDHQSAQHPDLPAVGFAYPYDAPANSPSKPLVLYSFRNIQKGSIWTSELLKKQLQLQTVESTTIALLCPSTPEFLFTWLGLIRLGNPVLLVAPQNQPEAIVHLCSSCQVDILLYDEVYEELATKSKHRANEKGVKTLQAAPIPLSTSSCEFTDILESKPDLLELSQEYKLEDTAYLFHSSGTSSGFPKPIPQSHNGAVGALPSFANGKKSATFSTTPLYHGGIADLFRAWTSSALIWLYPGKDRRSWTPIPIIPSKILLSLRQIKSQSSLTPAIKYFSSVPYVLQTLASDPDGLAFLSSLDCVGVGGAALPAESGDKLVAQGVNLVSRYGSAECGFLLSSHRNYKTDKEWQYLRTDTGVEHLAFEGQGDDKYELVVQPGWPHMAKQNRPDGSYATSDLLTPHSQIPHAWRYDSRADSQLTLITGKKFDPAPLEGDLASLELLDDAYVFGNGQPFPGALLFRSHASKALSDESFVEKVAPFIEKVNAKSQSHARIPRNMLVPVAYGENELQKSSKGTLLRNKAEETYGSIISEAYERLSAPTADEVPDDQVEKAIYDSVASITGAEIPPDQDLFAHGVDSLGSIQIRHFLHRILPRDGAELPIAVVEDCGSINNLADFVIATRHGKTSNHASDNELQMMHNLVGKYSNFSDTTSPSNTHEQLNDGTMKSHTILLTGATGALGAHILSQYLGASTTSHIYCLVRGVDDHAARSRITKALDSRKLPPLDFSQDKVTILPAKLAEPSLGLDDTAYRRLSEQVTHIIHAAWAVNFRWRLTSFERDHIAGTRHLLDLALSSNNRPTFAFCSSVASISSTPYSDTALVPEEISTDPSHATPLGYSRSKWVTEAILSRAQHAHPELPVQILRIGQLSGDSVHGIWNNAEAWPLMLGSVLATGCLPDLKQSLDWLPVDVAASSVIELANSTHSIGEKKRHEATVYHVANTHQDVTWQHALEWMKGFGEDFEVVPPSTWVERLAKLEENKGAKGHPALRLLGLWREAYAKGEKVVEKPSFDVSKASEVSEALRNVGTMDESYFRRLWEWVRVNAVAEKDGEK